MLYCIIWVLTSLDTQYFKIKILTTKWRAWRAILRKWCGWRTYIWMWAGLWPRDKTGAGKDNEGHLVLLLTSLLGEQRGASLWPTSGVCNERHPSPLPQYSCWEAMIVVPCKLSCWFWLCSLPFGLVPYLWLLAKFSSVVSGFLKVADSNPPGPGSPS